MNSDLVVSEMVLVSVLFLSLFLRILVLVDEVVSEIVMCHEERYVENE